MGKSAKALVVISDEDDGHIPFVQKHLSRELVIVDPFGHPLTFWRGGQVRATVSGERCLEGRNAVGTHPADVASVWLRKPLSAMRAHVEVNVAPEYRRYSRLAISRHADALHSSFRRAYWMSDYYAIERAENKALQLEVAQELGLRVPETIITSDPTAAASFLERHPETIVKPLISGAIPGGPNEYFLATRVPADRKLALAGLRWAPAIFQAAIDAVEDWRVTVVGPHQFPARIPARPGPAARPEVRDWRYPHHTGTTGFEAMTRLPRKESRMLRAFVRELGLRFAAFDLVLDRAGTIWFLEGNPNGQWAFIEQETGLPIGAATAEQLERRRDCILVGLRARSRERRG